MKKYIKLQKYIPYIINISLILVLFGVFYLNQPLEIGATVFNSAQVGSSPVNGYYLKTNGSVSTWAAVTGGGGGGGGIGWASSTQDLLIYNTNNAISAPYAVLIQSTGVTATTSNSILQVIGGFTSDNASSTVFSSTYASSTLGYFGTAYLPSLGTAAGTFLAVNSAGQVIATTTPGGASYTATYPITLTGTTFSFPATSTLYGTGSYGNFLMWNGTPQWTATSTLFTYPWSVANGGTGLTSATAGYFLIGSSATALQATSTMFILPNGSIGFGTTTPSTAYKADIYGNARIDNTDTTSTSTIRGNIEFKSSSQANGCYLVYGATTTINCL